MDKKFWASSFTLSGTILGAGILGLPYVFSKSGFIIGLFWLIILGLIMTFVNLSLAEITLKTRGNHQLSGYAKKYLGKWGRIIMFCSMIIGVYSALIAYLIGQSNSLSRIIPLNPIIMALFFWLSMTLILREGLKGLKKVETWGVLAIIITVITIFVILFPKISLQNLTEINLNKFTLPIGVILFAYLGFTSIPEIKLEIKGKEKLMKKAILIGSLIPLIVYIIFTSSIVGVLGNKVPQIATLAFGNIVNLLGIFTMLTSYLVLSFSLRDTFKYDLKLNKKTNFLLTSLLPITIYLILQLLNLDNFISIMSIGGIISGGISGIMILLINKKSKEKVKGKSLINMPINWPIIILISSIFIIGMILEILM